MGDQLREVCQVLYNIFYTLYYIVHPKSLVDIWTSSCRRLDCCEFGAVNALKLTKVAENKATSMESELKLNWQELILSGHDDGQLIVWKMGSLNQQVVNWNPDKHQWQLQKFSGFAVISATRSPWYTLVPWHGQVVKTLKVENLPILCLKWSPGDLFWRPNNLCVSIYLPFRLCPSSSAQVMMISKLLVF